MDTVIRTIEPAEAEVVARAAGLAFSQPFDTERFEATLGTLEPDRTLAAWEGDTVVATAGAATFRLSVPGGDLGAAGVRGVGVLPTHRRRGLLTELMRRQVDDVRGRGEPLACLWASESRIYRRFGYGLAVLGMGWEAARARTEFLPDIPVSLPVRLVDDDDEIRPVMTEVHQRLWRSRPGIVDRSPAWIDYHLRRRGQVRHALVDGPSGAEAYASYQVTPAWGVSGPEHELFVAEALAVTPEAEGTMWRYLLDTDLVRTVKAGFRPADEPLALMLADTQALQRRVTDAMWVRLVDVEAALTGRRYSADVHVVLEVSDAFCPWNEGRWLLEGGPDGARCTRTSAPPDLSLDTADLAATFLGGIGLGPLVRAGRVVERADGAAARAHRALAWDPPPWAVTFF
ncbi:MAG TPA: GNAT family N-acetyltransferase [Acidimicrobiales bacterium]|nr:GNAT family N-acetyltransferase [Acidimicrobiales bacterium]